MKAVSALLGEPSRRSASETKKLLLVTRAFKYVQQGFLKVTSSRYSGLGKRYLCMHHGFHTNPLHLSQRTSWTLVIEKGTEKQTSFGFNTRLWENLTVDMLLLNPHTNLSVNLNYFFRWTKLCFHGENSVIRIIFSVLLQCWEFSKSRTAVRLCHICLVLLWLFRSYLRFQIQFRNCSAP